jgi:hypothetical protein
MLEQKLNALRVMVGILLAGVVALGGIGISLLENVNRNQETLKQMRIEARGALEQRAPELNARLDRFEQRLDAADAQMNGLDGKFRAAEDRFVSRVERELPGVLDRYLESRAHELVRQQR